MSAVKMVYSRLTLCQPKAWQFRNTWTWCTQKCVHRKRESLILRKKEGTQNGHLLLSNQVWKSSRIKETVSLGPHYCPWCDSNMFYDGHDRLHPVVLAFTYNRRKCEFYHVDKLDCHDSLQLLQCHVCWSWLCPSGLETGKKMICFDSEHHIIGHDNYILVLPYQLLC